MSKREIILSFAIGVITSVFAALLMWTTGDPFDVFRENGLFRWILISLPVLEVIGYFIARQLFGNIKILGQLARFGMVGLMNFLVDTGILTALALYTGVEGGLGLIWLNIISVTIAITNSYLWNRNWTFRDKEPITLEGIFVFILVTLGGIVINSAIVYGVTTMLPVSGVLTGTRRITLAKVLATGVSLLWNFFGYRMAVFKKPESTNIAQG